MIDLLQGEIPPAVYWENSQREEGTEPPLFFEIKM